ARAAEDQAALDCPAKGDVEHRSGLVHRRRAQSRIRNHRDVEPLHGRGGEPAQRDVAERGDDVAPQELLVPVERLLPEFAQRLPLAEPPSEVVAGPEPRGAERPDAAAERRVMRQREPELFCFFSAGESPEPSLPLLLGCRVDAGVGDHGEPLAALDNGCAAQRPSPLVQFAEGGSTGFETGPGHAVVPRRGLGNPAEVEYTCVSGALMGNLPVRRPCTYYSVKKRGRNSSCGTYRDAWRKIARSVPGASSPWSGITNVWRSPMGPVRRSFRWLPVCPTRANPKSARIDATAWPESARSLPGTGCGFNLHGNNQRGGRREVERDRIFAIEIERHRLLQVSHRFVQGPALRDDGRVHALGDVESIAPADIRFN